MGAITEDGDRFFSRIEEYITADHAEYIILELCEGFWNDLLVVLDGAPHLQASAVTGRQVRDDLVFVTEPAYSTELNPVEECWRQFHTALDNPFFGSLTELTTAIDTALNQLQFQK